MDVSRGLWDDIASTLPAFRIRYYKIGHIFLFQGEIPQRALVVRKGFIVAYSIRSSGDEQIIALFSEGDILPVEWLFKRSPVALYYYRAFTDCELMAIDRDELLAELSTNQALSNRMLHELARSFIGETVHIHALGHSHAQQKLIKLMHYLVLRFGVASLKQSDCYLMPFKLTHAQLGSMIGVTRESISVEAAKLRKKGAFTIKKGYYTINLPLLIRTLGSEEFDSLTIRSSS